MKRLIAVLAGAVVLGSVPACSSGPEPIRIGAVYPMSGSQGPGGLDEYRGVRLAVDLVNDEGGVRGRPVQLDPVDVASGDAAPAAIELLARRGIRLVFGSYGSTISQPAGMEATRKGMLFWETGAVGTMPGNGPGRTFFRMAPGGAVLGLNAVDFVADQLAPRLGVAGDALRFAVANVDDAYGREVARGAVDRIGARDLTLAGQFPYDPQRPDVASVVRDVAASGANVLFVSGYVEDAVALRRETVRQGLRLVASIGTSSSYCMPAFGAALGSQAVGLFASDKPDEAVIDPTGLTPDGRGLLARAGRGYRDRYRIGMSEAALAGFSSAWALLHHVLPLAASADPAAVATAAHRASIPEGGLPNGSGLRFAPAGSAGSGDNLLAASVIEEWVGVRERVVVWPPRFATRSILAIRPEP